ncbi:hypothetical protein ACFRH6_19265 [Streptomyces sp. NPDC056749]
MLPVLLHRLLLLAAKGARAAEGCKTERCPVARLAVQRSPDPDGTRVLHE